VAEGIGYTAERGLVAIFDCEDHRAWGLVVGPSYFLRGAGVWLCLQSLADQRIGIMTHGLCVWKSVPGNRHSQASAVPATRDHVAIPIGECVFPDQRREAVIGIYDWNRHPVIAAAISAGNLRVPISPERVLLAFCVLLDCTFPSMGCRQAGGIFEPINPAL